MLILASFKSQGADKSLHLPICVSEEQGKIGNGKRKIPSIFPGNTMNNREQKRRENPMKNYLTRIF